MNDDSSKNSYLDQVVVEQQRLEENLKVKKAMPMSVARSRGAMVQAPSEPASANAVEVRITGFGRWKTVLVPPNAYVVHTRRGKPEPLHMGLGVSFAFNPYSDAFLVVPGAMQTILINARCISRERQGVLVQSYVQWIVQDIGTAYKKLDFSDAEDPMRLVNLQLREQAEAALKDKVSTMSIDEVLADKQPIIEELTARLRAVAEGGGGDKGLGLRIITVQIKEAVVSSQRLWENLQTPFRAERARIARLAAIESEEAIRRRELEASQAKQEGEMAVGRGLAVLRSTNEAEAFDLQSREKARRANAEHENARALAQHEHETRLRAVALEKERVALEHQLAMNKLELSLVEAKSKLEAELAQGLSRAQAELERTRLAATGAQARQAVENALTPAGLEARLVAALPDLVAKLPKPTELRSVSISGGDASLSSAISQVAAVVQAVRGAAGRESA